MRARLLTMGLLLLTPLSAAAQGRMPHTGANAVGGEVGIFLPRQDGMKTGPDVQGFFEHYLTARDSVRLGVEWANPKFEAEPVDSIRQVRVGGDIVHNWEGGAVHPFAGAGLGVYFLQLRDNGHDSGIDDKKLGGTLFGGAEFFTSKTFSVKAEARYHVVSKWDGGRDPSGLALTVGVKSYF